VPPLNEGATNPAIQLPAWQILDRSLLPRIPAGAYIVSTRTNCAAAPVFVAKIDATVDLNEVWQRIRRAGLAEQKFIIIADAKAVAVISGPIPLDDRGWISMRAIGRRNAQLNRIFAPAAGMAS